MKKLGDVEFQSVIYRNINTPEARAMRLDELPAVYAWYRTLRFGECISDPDRLIEHIEELLDANLSDTFSGKVGSLYSVQVNEKAKSLSDVKRNTLSKLASHVDGREYLEEILSSATFLQAPLYVGKANKLKSRIEEHVTGKSGLMERFENAGIKPSSCILRYRYFSKEELDLATRLSECGDEHIILLIEELISKLSPAAFVRRHG